MPEPCLTRITPAPLPIVHLMGEALPVAPLDANIVDPHFQVTSTSRLLLKNVTDAKAAVEYLCHLVLARPSALRTHVQRVLLLIHVGDGASLYGALVDLFIVLANKGEHLKQRMLNKATPLLSRTAAAYLRRHIRNGIPPCDPALSRARSSVLRLGYEGRYDIVSRIDDHGQPIEVDPLTEAQALFRFGQPDQAMETLENALLIEPNDSTLARELLELYLRLGQHNRFEMMREQLMSQVESLPQGWAAPGLGETLIGTLPE
ncbi:MAG: hypothetical protein PHI49_01595 [Halothiobacillaceae bacterium]|nr:hypothetical protein [Halothiobacillaceae bacterium]MDY0049123.1 hypothetical protein [Halothiobacillaceae bacterium]